MSVCSVEEFPDDDALRRLRLALNRPTLTRQKIPAHQGLADCQKWLREHAQEFAGQWVAVRDGHLLAAAATLRDLRRMVETDPDTLFVDERFYFGPCD